MVSSTPGFLQRGSTLGAKVTGSERLDPKPSLVHLMDNFLTPNHGVGGSVWWTLVILALPPPKSLWKSLSSKGHKCLVLVLSWVRIGGRRTLEIGVVPLASCLKIRRPSASQPPAEGTGVGRNWK